jgi:hypothetical protein
VVHLWVSLLSSSHVEATVNNFSLSVEAIGRTLEELAWVYDQPNPVKASLKVDKVIVQADGKVTEKVVEPANV